MKLNSITYKNHTIDSYEVGISNIFDYSPFGAPLNGRTMTRNFSTQICHDSTVVSTQTILNDTFDSWGNWTATGSAVLTYISGEMQVTNPNVSKKDIDASKAFTTGSAVLNYIASFDITDNSCANVQLWPPSSTPIAIDVYIKDNTNNIVASGSYTTAGTYNLSFTPASAGATYTIEFSMTNAAALCFFAVDNVQITYQDTDTVQVCENVSGEKSYPRGFNGQLKDDEVSGKGNSYSAEFWQYDSRLGQRWNIDPVVKPHESPYAVFANNPIWFIDPNGADTSFTDNEARETFLTAYNKSKDLLKQVSTEYNNVSQKIRELEYRGKNNRLSKDERSNLKNLRSRVSGLKDRLDNLQTIRNDFRLILRKNTPLFEYSSSKEAFDKEEKSSGRKLKGFVSPTITERETSEGVIKQVIHVYVRAHQDATNIHENRHGVQLVNGLPDNDVDMEYDAYKVEGAYDPIGMENFRKAAYQEYRSNINPTLAMPYESFDLRRAVQEVVKGNHFH